MVIPGILEKDFSEIEKKISLLEGVSDHFHIDFIDGVFAKNKTILDPSLFSKFTKSHFFEAHLMVDNPSSYLDKLAEAGFKRFIGHVERMPDQVEFIAKGERLGEVGLALDGKTPYEKIEVSLEDLDILLLLAIDAGFSGQSFKPSYLEKIKQVPQWFKNIEVDGGINDRTLPIAKKMGANIFAVTSFIYESVDPAESFKKIRDLAQALRVTASG